MTLLHSYNEVKSLSHLTSVQLQDGDYSMRILELVF